MKFLIMYGVLPVLYLMGIAMSSEAFRSGFGVDLSFIIVIFFVAFYLLLYKKRIRGGMSYAWWIYLLVVPTFMITAIKGGELAGMFTSTLALFLPFALEPFVPGNDRQTIRSFYLTYIVSMLILLMYANFGFLGKWNPNCIAYLIYLGIASAAVILSENRKNAIVWALFFLAIAQLMVTQCRNVISSLVIVAIIIMFKNTFSKKLPYSILSLTAILYPVIFPIITKAIENTPAYSYLRSFLEGFFEKQGVFSGRNMLFPAAEKLLESDLVCNIFGFGNYITKEVSVHNDYYTVRYAYGIIGTIIIGVLLYMFFRKAYVLIKKGDNITYGCVAVIIGVLYQQATEGWFLGVPLIVLMAFVYMAIVIKRYRISERQR